MAPPEDRRPAARHLARLTRQVLDDAPALAATRLTPRLRAVQDALYLEEILSSTALAGIRLDASAGAALLSRGVALGGHRLEVYEAVADYADAARLARTRAHEHHPPHGFVRTEDILELHRAAMRRTGRAPGAWRERNLGPVGRGLVPPAHWLVPREVAAFVDRHTNGPDSGISPLLWVAGAHARLLRIQPFEGGNGRVARLVANLLLRRLSFPAASFARGRATRYASALAIADSGDLVPLAELTAEAVQESMTQLLAGTSPDDLRPLRELAPADRLGALVKAAQRGRLRVVRRGVRFYTTPTWLDEYETARRTRMDAAST